MKKFFVIFAVAGALVACNNSSDSTTTTDSTHVDSNTMAPAPMDTTRSATDTLHAGTGVDTTKKAKDSTKK